MDKNKTQNILDVAELILGASVIVELTKKNPNKDKLIENIIALNKLHYAKLGYEVIVKKSKNKGVN